MASTVVAAIDIATTHNNPLSDDVQATAHLLISDLELAIALLQESPTHPHLDEQREQYADMVTRCRSAVATQRKVPNEILVEIFCLAVDFPLVIQPNWNIIRRDPPWNISHVCSRWRRVLFSTSEVWSSLVLSAGSKDWQRRSIRIARDIFARSSGNRLLSLEADLYLYSSWREKHESSLSKLIVSYAGRWKDLNLGTFVQTRLKFKPAELASPSGPFTSLESLRVSPNCTSSLSVFSGAPMLRNVTLNTSKPSSEIFQLPLGNLTVLRIYAPCLDPTTLLAILQRCTSVILCVLPPGRDTNQPSLIVKSTTSTTLCSLQHLHLTTKKDHIDALSFLSFLDLPALVSFRLLDMYVDNTVSDWRHWRAGFTPSIVRSRRLERLTLGTIESSDLLNLMEQTPTLVELELVSHLPRPVRRRVASGELVPKLTNLTCGIYGMDCLEGHVWMLRRRRGVHVDFAGLVSEVSGRVTDIKVVVFRALGAPWGRECTVQSVLALNDEGWRVRVER